MNAKNSIVKSLAASCLALVAGICSATQLPQPAAHWLAKNVSGQKCPDETGTGPDLTIGANIGTTDNALRGTVFDLRRAKDAADNSMSFVCPAAPNRTLSFWVNHPNGESGCASYDVYLVYDFCGLSLKHPYNVSRKNYNWSVKVGLDETDVGMSVTIERDIWRHVAVTVADKGAGKADVCAYVDGKLVSSQTDLDVPTAASCTTRISSNAPWSWNQLNAMYDDIAFWTEALTAAEVKSLYLSTRKMTMIGHWPMNRIDVDGSGVRTTPDVSGTGGPLTLGSANTLAEGVDGLNAIAFNGTTDSYAEGASKLGYYVSDWTMTYWIRRDPRCGWSNLISGCYPDGSGAGIIMYNGSLITMAGNMFGLGDADVFKACGRNGEWVHGAIRVEFYDYDKIDDPDEWQTAGKARFTSFINGVKTFEYVKENATFSDCAQFSQGTFIIGNRVWREGSFFYGALQDVRLYAGALTDEEIKAVYVGPAEVSAGDDFTVASATAELHGRVSPYSVNKVSEGFISEHAWTLVSAPVGGESAIIANPHGEATSVTLPVEGTYVFRLSSTGGGRTASDDVTVVRTATTSSPDLGVSPSVVEQSGLCAVVSAGDADGRIRWSKVSGPSGVWFSDYTATSPVVTFGAAGTYRLACRQEKEGAVAEEVLEVVVSGDSIADQLKVGLDAYWPVDMWSTYGAANTSTFVQTDSQNGCKLTHNNGQADALKDGAGYGVGPAASYALCNVTNAAYYASEDLASRYDDDNPYMTMSFWMRHSSDCKDNVWMATLMTIQYAIGFHYLPEGGTSTDFEIAHQDDDYNLHRMRFQGPAVNLINRWVHVVVQFDQLNQGGSEVWVDGVKLAVKSGSTGRRRTTEPWSVLVGNHSSFDPPVADPSGAAMSKLFPGSLDEIRFYNRKLTPVEIKYLAAYPAPGATELAASVTVPLDKIVFSNKESSLIAAGAFAEAGKDVTCKWSVISGNAEGLVFDDDTLRQPTITGRKSGEYVLQLVVDDGVRKTFSDPVRVTVEKLGLAITIW